MSRNVPPLSIASAIGRRAACQRGSSPPKPDCARGLSPARYAASKMAAIEANQRSSSISPRDRASASSLTSSRHRLLTRRCGRRRDPRTVP
jgi:hypothetical protein